MIEYASQHAKEIEGEMLCCVKKRGCEDDLQPDGKKRRVSEHCGQRMMIRRQPTLMRFN